MRVPFVTSYLLLCLSFVACHKRTLQDEQASPVAPPVVGPSSTLESGSSSGSLPTPQNTGNSGNDSSGSQRVLEYESVSTNDQGQKQSIGPFLRDLAFRLGGLFQGMLALDADYTRTRSRVGSVIIHWGNSDGPPGAASYGAQLLYSGHGFGSYYNHPSPQETDCIKGGEQGQHYKGTEADVIYPLVTGNAVYLPDSIPELKLVSCSVLFIPSTTFVMKGGDSCPASWTRLYGGYLLGGHYTHTGGGTNRLCVRAEGFDTGRSYSAPGHYSYVYGVHTRQALDQVPGQPSDYFTKCAVCAR